jgi:hypothetical protein
MKSNHAYPLERLFWPAKRREDSVERLIGVRLQGRILAPAIFPLATSMYIQDQQAMHRVLILLDNKPMQHPLWLCP